MAKTLTKRQKKITEIVGDKKTYTAKEAVAKLKEVSSELKVKFDETLEVSFKLGIDPKQNDQQLRSSIPLPGGTGKEVKIVVITRGDSVKEAEAAGATAGSEELIKKIEDGWMDFDKLVVTPDVMPQLAKLGRVLGPKGLMPNPKDGTVTPDVVKAVNELKAGKVGFRAEKDSGVVHAPIGKMSFSEENLLKNVKAIVEAVNKGKPSGAKGIYIKNVYLSTTMGPGLRLDVNSLQSIDAE